VVAYGRNRSGTRRFRCKACGRTFTPEGRTRKTPAEKARAVEGLLAERVSQRGIARALGVSRNTIRALRKKGPSAS
jgi:transposase-like protein